jgi:hypothetical protein
VYVEVYKYNVVNNVWSLVRDMIFVAEGDDADGAYLNSMLRYDPASDTWSEMAPISQARCYFGMFVAGSCIYAVGGAYDVDFERVC